MEIKIKNLSLTLELIRANPQAAEREAKNWQQLVARLSLAYPEIQILKSQEEFSAWTSGHPELNIDPSIFKGKEIIEAYFYLREQKEVQNAPKAPMEINPQLDALGMIGLPALAIIFRDTPKILEEDKDYQKIIASKKIEWQEKNPGKNLWESEEGLNYLYGDPNDPDKKTIDDGAEEKFRELAKTNNILTKKLEKYDLEKHKIYKNPNNDPSLVRLSAKINEESQIRISLLKKGGKNITDEELKKTFLKLEEKNYLIFARKNEAKASAYVLFDERLKKALEKIPKKEIAKEKEEEEEKKEKKEDQISPGQVRRLAEELQKEQKISQISNLRRVPKPQFRPRPFTMGESGYRAVPRINLGAGGRLGGQMGRTGQLAGNLGKTAGQGMFRGATALGSAGIGAALPWIIGGLVILLFFVLLILIIGGGMGGGSTGGGIGGDVAGCTFYRGGDKEPGLQFGNPQMAALVSEISGKVGVPSSIIAGIMRVESGQAVSTKDESFLNNDYDAHCSIEGWNEKRSPTIEECSQRGIAFGVMQFTPNTFLTTYNENGSDLRSIFGKTDLKTTLDPQENMAPQNIFRIYSIKDSITAAAYKVKTDKKAINGDGQYDETTVKKIAERYYGTNEGTTNYKGADGSTQNYGNDLWKSFQNCQTIPGKTIDSGLTNADLISVLDWTQKINSVLETGLGNDFNRMVTAITNGIYKAVTRTGKQENTSPDGLYWCTNLVIDAYNLAGKSGLGDNQQSVVSMRNFWKVTAGYKYVEYYTANHQAALSSVSPGFAMFLETIPGVFTQKEHVAIVKSINIDPRGNGAIETYDSNTSARIHTYPVALWEVKNTHYPLMGFGGL